MSRKGVRGRSERRLQGSDLQQPARDMPGANWANCLNDISAALLKTVSGRISIIVFSALGYWSGSNFVILMRKP